MALIRIERGKDRGRSVPIAPGRPVVVGREQRNELAVKDHMMSRRHCELSVGADGRVTVRDLRSSNGTFVNGRRLAPEVETPLLVEDKLQAGDTLMALLDDAAGASQGREGLLTGKTLSGYRVMERIGRGGMGTVYKALQVSLERTVALKVLARDLAEDPRRKALFASEARAAGKLNHPNIVQVYDVGEDQGFHFYSMEFMERGSLEELLSREGKMLVPRALEAAIDAAKGLAFAERARIVHRDVKPGNLMVNAEGVTKLGDLGIARAHDAATSTASAPAVDEAAPAPLPPERVGEELITGSPLYMAPEQSDAGPVDHRADLYSLGATLFHALSGEPPFTAPSPREVIVKHRSEAPRRLSDVDPAIPADVSALVGRLLEKRPDDRVQGAALLEEELRRLAQRYPEGWRPGDPPASASGVMEGVPEPASAPRPISKPLVAALILAAALPFALGGTYLVKRRMDQAEEDRKAEAREKADMEARRLSAERAAEEAQARAAAKKREAEAEAARASADAFLASHADDMAGALARFQDVAKRFGGTEAARRAGEQAAAIEGALGEIEAAKGERKERESDAKAELWPLEEAAAKGTLRDAAALRKKLTDLKARWKGTDAAEKGVPAALKALALRIDALRKGTEKAFDAAIAADDFATAKTALDVLEGEGAEELQGFLGERRKQLAAAEKARAAFREAERLKAVAGELALVEACLDGERRAKLLFGEMEGELRGLLASRLKTAEARAHAERNARILSAEGALVQRLVEHVNKGARPPLAHPVAKGIDGTAVKADAQGITFQAKAGGGAIEVKRAYATLTAEERLRFLSLASGMTPLERCGLAALFLEEKDAERARKELDRAAKEAEKAGDEAAQALAKELAALPEAGGGQ